MAGVAVIRLGLNAIPDTTLPWVDQRSQKQIQDEALAEAMRKYGPNKQK